MRVALRWARDRPSSMLVVAALVLFSFALGGCRDDGPLTVRKILVDVEPAAEGRADREMVRDTLRAYLRRSPGFELKEGAEDGATVRLRVFVASEGHRSGQARVRPASDGSGGGPMGAGVDPARPEVATTPSAPELDDTEREIAAALEGDPAAADVPSGEDEEASEGDGLPTGHPSLRPPPAMVSLSLSAIGEDKKKGRYHYRGAGVIKEDVPSSGGVDLDALIARAVEQAVDELQNARAAEGLPSADLIATLESEKASPLLRRQAIGVLGKRKDLAAVPALSALLLTDDKELANLALRALTDIGDPRAVDAIITFADGKPSIIRRQAIEAVKVMGTRKGQAWLFTLSTGHPDPDVQTAASSALAALGVADEKTAQAPNPEPGGG